MRILLILNPGLQVIHVFIDIFCTKEPNWTNVEWEVDRLKKKGA